VADRPGVLAGWAIALGTLTAFIGGALVNAPTATAELRWVAGYTLVAVPTCYVLITRNEATWYHPQPFVRFAGFFAALVVVAVPLDLLANAFLGTGGPIARGGEVLAFVLGVAAAAWTIFRGGAGWLWTRSRQFRHTSE